MRILIIGCGRVGSTVASQLSTKGHEVTVIDQQSSAFDNLPIDFRGRTIVGDVMAKNVLRRAEIDQTDALAALTNSDSLNALMAHIAHKEYGIGRVVARNYDPRQLRLQEAFGVPLVGSASWGAQRVEDLLTGDLLQTALIDRTVGISVYRLEVPEVWSGRSPQEVLPEDGSGILSWTRAGRRLEASKAEAFRTGDIVFLSVHEDQIESVRRQLASRDKRSE